MQNPQTNKFRQQAQRIAVSTKNVVQISQRANTVNSVQSAEPVN
ncbi:MAG: hypothetical protein Q9M28_03055 [Mariprofundaceae bacterium]|nr:hypothetical protein [Mariprofundaceae bacterium]